ncbi:hypothetical protein Fmac_028575 [Flemingia macrophylla]|uniref:Uncharacterized protein n=1 Tax=Flemingia macrophylla TaxID=520843 RepID=A0ABD1L7Z3_9FABA
MAPNSYQFSARKYAIVIRRVHDVATDTSAETKKLEGKLDALVNLVTQLAANQNPASVARQFSARNDVIVFKGVHDVATDSSRFETRTLEGKLDAHVNFVARDCGIRSSNDHHTSVCPSSQQSGVDDNPEAYAANVYSGPPQQQRQGTRWKRWLLTPSSAVQEMMTFSLEEFMNEAIDTSADTRKQEDKLDALVNLVTQLAANQKPASVAKVCGIRSSNDHHTSVCPSSQQSGVGEHTEAYAANTYCRPPQQQIQGT